MTHQFLKKNLPHERTSLFAPKGSITIEASLALSFFFFAVVCLIFLFEMMAIQTRIKSALYAAGREAAQEAYANPALQTGKLERRIAKIVGEERLDNSLVVDGSRGLDCSASKKYGNTSIMDLTVAYRIQIPVTAFSIPVISRKETIRVKGWTGYETGFAGAADDTVVYVTDYGLVYHADMHCSYLDLSIRSVKEDAVEGLRNQSGGKYRKCPRCADKPAADHMVYVTDYGDKYHTSLECSGLKRNIYAVLLKDVNGLGGCSKCVK